MAHGVMCGTESKFSMLWVAYLPPPTRCHHLHPAGRVCFHVCEWVCFSTRVWIFDQTHRKRSDAKSPLLWHWSGVASNMALRSPSMVPYWIHMELQPLSFDLAIQQKGNNGRRSPKGERLRMSVGSLQKSLYALHSKMQWFPAKIMFRSQGQKWKKYPDSSIINHLKKRDKNGLYTARLS